MSTKNYFPNYTIKIENYMLTKSLTDGYFVTHFISQFTLKEVMGDQNVFLKREYMKMVFDKIKSSVLAI